MSINEIIVLMMIFLSLHSFIEMCMQALLRIWFVRLNKEETL